MLTQNEFELWCERLKFSPETRVLVAGIRAAGPSRRVKGAAGNVSGRYPSRKMGCTIQFESHRNELAAILEFEHSRCVEIVEEKCNAKEAGKGALAYSTHREHLRHTGRISFGTRMPDYKSHFEESDRSYSCLSAIIGSTLAARRAGRKLAAAAIPASRTVATMSVARSYGSIPNNRALAARAATR